jgi:hypothetical protein
MGPYFFSRSISEPRLRPSRRAASDWLPLSCRPTVVSPKRHRIDQDMANVRHRNRSAMARRLHMGISPPPLRTAFDGRNR